LRKVDIQSDAVTYLLGISPLFEKTVVVEAREVFIEEEVKTIVGDGFLETTNIAKPGDFIVTNPTGEQYILGAKKFASRYEKTSVAGFYKARGRIRAVLNPYGTDIEILAPWGEPQFGDAQCLLATSVDDLDTPIGTDRYIIEAAAFVATYRKV